MVIVPNAYYLETVDRKGYRRTSREKVNHLIDIEKAEWEGTDYHETEHYKEYRHYARRLG